MGIQKYCTDVGVRSGDTPGLVLPADPPGQADITWHDGHALGVDGAEVGVFENPGDVGLCSFLKCKESTTPIKSFRSRT